MLNGLATTLPWCLNAGLPAPQSSSRYYSNLNRIQILCSSSLCSTSSPKGNEIQDTFRVPRDFRDSAFHLVGCNVNAISIRSCLLSNERSENTSIQSRFARDRCLLFSILHQKFSQDDTDEHDIQTLTRKLLSHLLAARNVLRIYSNNTITKMSTWNQKMNA